MHRKVVRLVELVEKGYEVRGVAPGRDGSVTLHLRQGRESTDLDFAFFEVPAMLQATKVVGQAG